MYCPKCGTQNIEDARFCRGCGADIALVPQAMTGALTQPRAVGHDAEGKPYDAAGKRIDRKSEPPRLDKAITSTFTGLGFLLVAFSVLIFAPAGRIWWFWMLLPAFSMLGAGAAEYVRLKQSRGEEVRLPGTRPREVFEPPPQRASAIPPGDTSELMPQPPSVTERTTRHLSMDREPQAVRVDAPSKEKGREG